MRRRKIPSIMFQGTSSNAGKSLMATAFCRILSDKGIKVAPFKAQNMSLNSFVTTDGGEMGRAQVLQARAARVEPDVRMNPLLLKPMGNQGSQVIVMGKPLDNYQARQYFDRTLSLKETVREAYDELAGSCDAIVLEGAGSPGEVNLKKFDIVNMFMAAWAKAPVVLVGDIDRGGLYASFIGHMTVMDDWERDLVHSFLVNKFRGDAALLKEAHDYVLDKTGKPVIGVMPWVRDHRLPEEDGFDFEERYGKKRHPGGIGGIGGNTGNIVVGVVELPHVSNSTDFDPFLNEPEVSLVRIDSPDAYTRHRPDAVIIPGTRNVITDLAFIRKNGLAECLIDAEKSGELFVIGICGGYQMLGRKIEDPHGIEGRPGELAPGLGLLDLSTVLEEEKQLTQTETSYLPDGSPVIGYEIHHGRSRSRETPLFAREDLGCRRGKVWGTYLHGIFENAGVRRAFLNEIDRRNPGGRGIGDAKIKSLDEAIDEFADVFRRSVDVEALMDAAGL